MKLCQAWLHVPAAVSKSSRLISDATCRRAWTITDASSWPILEINLLPVYRQGKHLHGRLVEADSVIQTRAVVLVPEPSQSDDCEPQLNRRNSKRRARWHLASTEALLSSKNLTMSKCPSHDARCWQFFFESKLSWMHRRMYVRTSQNKSLQFCFFGHATKVRLLPLKNEYVTVVSVPPACENVLMAFQLCVRFSFLNPGNAPVPFVQGCQMRRARRRWR